MASSLVERGGSVVRAAIKARMLFVCDAGSVAVVMMMMMLAQTWSCCGVDAAPAAQAMLAPDANAIPVWVWSDYEDNADYQTGMPGYMLLCMEALRKNAPPPRFDIRVVDKHSIRTYVDPFPLFFTL